MNTKKIWVVETRADMDIPTITEYSLLGFTKDGLARVLAYGEEIILRRTVGRHVFVQPSNAKKFIDEKLEMRMRYYEKKLNEVRDKLQKGVVLYVKPETNAPILSKMLEETAVIS